MAFISTETAINGFVSLESPVLPSDPYPVTIISPGGNDYEIAQAVSNRPLGRVVKVEKWEDTWNHLKQLG